ncbi:RabGAP/TBC [Hyphopichia burtonii NRRL Y-1933]|uniref:GTPase-activating protein GYP5 n=1 Tax=Hyphopichia burtonii NRRL Y-1933 TaxID=984485 RepID=A0A1E4RFN9_9ASCO|nr:RabGAP/TBC [Hyphopichia burtonii NRRL Y-1933]ODV66068.1 RabGAP/TBC [Hyphopichia burtonii NRRL Y-1933]
MKGIPKEFRGIVWQVIAKLKNFQLEEFYLQLKNETSIHEKSIKRDLTRTSFFTNVDQIKKTDELFNVIKAYSLFDPDVGYTQGMIFIVVPLIMNMNESECFGLLVTLMKDYKLRSLFCPEMKGLHLLLYEFDRLLEIYSPRLYNHLVKQGIKSSMYASQWFLTFFAYKFPLDIVLRIFDIIITQGIEAILKFSINLMIKNESNLINLKFDKLLEFLKSNLFNLYVNEEFINFDKDGNIISTATAPPAGSSNTSKSSKRASTGLNRSGSVSKRFSLLGGNRGSIYGGSNTNKQQKGYYKLDELVYDAMQINVVPLDLNKFELEFENIYINETSKIEEIEELRIQNGKLRHDIKLLETEYANVNRDHIEIVQHMVDIKVELPEILNDNEDLHKQIDQLRLDIEELQSKMVSSPDSESSPSLNSSVLKSPAIPTKIENDIQELLVINAQETEKFANLEDELHNLMAEDEKLTNELKSKTAKKWFPWNKKA